MWSKCERATPVGLAPKLERKVVALMTELCPKATRLRDCDYVEFDVLHHSWTVADVYAARQLVARVTSPQRMVISFRVYPEVVKSELLYQYLPSRAVYQTMVNLVVYMNSE